jgi:hypothetical protein
VGCGVRAQVLGFTLGFMVSGPLPPTPYPLPPTPFPLPPSPFTHDLFGHDVASECHDMHLFSLEFRATTCTCLVHDMHLFSLEFRAQGSLAPV